MEHLSERREAPVLNALLPRAAHLGVVRHPEVITGYPMEPPSDNMSGGLLEYWRIIRRNKGIIIVIAFIGCLVGYLTTIAQTPIFLARTSVEIENINQNFLGIKQVNPTDSGSGGAEVSDIQTQIRIIQSESLIERVATKLQAAQLPTTAENRISTWRKALNLPSTRPSDAYQESVKAASRGLRVRAAGQTRIIEISIDSTDPNTAATFANTLANEYIEQSLESRWKATERTTEWLTRQIDDMRVKLERSEDKLQDYARRAGLIFTNEKTNVSEEKLRQLQTNLSTAEADRIAKQSRFEIASSSPAEALPDVLNDTGIREYQAKLTELRRQIAELSSTYTPEYPKVKRAEAQYLVIESAFNRERGAILKRIRNDYDEALRKERLIAAAYATQAHEVSGEGERSIQYNILKREVDSNRQLYDTMLGQLKQASIASALRASNIRVVDPAKPPRRPYKPNSTQSAGVGGLIGFCLAIGFVVMRNRADRTIQQPGDSVAHLNLPELGIIPAASLDTVGSKRQIGTSNNNDERVELITWKRAPSMVAEAFRSTLISILFSHGNSEHPRTIVLTSANPGEGKSTVVSNLAIAIAEVGNRVLVIDGDLRKPRQHSIFDQSASPGLSELLRSRSNLPLGDLSEYIRPTAVPNLFLLPAGTSTSAVLNLFYGNQMSEILNHLKQQFDTVLIDTPPMLQISDARLLGRMVDRVILVVRSKTTTRDAAQAALQRFHEDGTTVLGTILNDWNPKNSPAGYYGYYDKHYTRYGYYNSAEPK